MPDPNRLLRTARERTPSGITPGQGMSRSELAEAVNSWLWASTRRRYDLDGHHIAKVRREALVSRMEVKDLRRCSVTAER